MRPSAFYLDVTSTVAAGFVSLVFLRALLHKLGRYVEWIGALHEYRLIPARFVPLVAIMIIAAEAYAAAGLMFPGSRVGAAMLGCGLLLVYAIAIGVNLLRARTSIDCGCGGAGHGISRLHLLRNVMLALCCAPAMPSVNPGPTGLAVAAAAAGCVLALWFPFLGFEQLLGNRTHAVTTEYSLL
jgi:hypothetical protein